MLGTVSLRIPSAWVFVMLDYFALTLLIVLLLTILAVVATAEATVREAIARKDRADSIVADLTFQVETAEKELQRMESFLDGAAVSQSEVDRTSIQVRGLQAPLNTAVIDAKAAEETIVKSKASLPAGSWMSCAKSCFECRRGRTL